MEQQHKEEEEKKTHISKIFRQREVDGRNGGEGRGGEAWQKFSLPTWIKNDVNEIKLERQQQQNEGEEGEADEEDEEGMRLALSNSNRHNKKQL